MKKIFALMIACAFAMASAYAEETANPEATPEATPSEAVAPAPEAAPAAAPAVRFDVPQSITEHLNLRFPGREVKGMTREGVTYLIDLGDGDHVRYDACFNPICYGDHSHDCKHVDSPE